MSGDKDKAVETVTPGGGAPITVIYQGGGVTYVLTGVVFPDAQRARLAFQELTANRKRPFHWRQEGPILREAPVTLLETTLSPPTC